MDCNVACTDQHHPGRLHEQDAQVAIAALRYLAQDGAVSGRHLFRDVGGQAFDALVKPPPVARQVLDDASRGSPAFTC
jgi:hypothetical protein